MYRAGIDIGGTKIRVGILNEENKLVQSKKILVREISDPGKAVAQAMEELCALEGIQREAIVSCGIGVPGTVSEDGRRVLKAPNLEILPDNAADVMEQALGIPVALVQDSRAAAWGEYCCGGGVGAKTVVCMTLGTGIGTGIVMDGKIFHGALGSAGELGHLPVCENGRPCGCGKTGCLEKYAAGRGLDQTAEELLGAGTTAADLFEAAKNGNKAAQNAVNEAIKMLGGAVVAIINLLSPDCILFSGGLSEQEDLYLKPLIEYTKEHCYSSGKLPEIGKAALGEDSPLVGAALLPIPKKRKPLLSASIMCGDALNYGKALEDIRDAGIHYVHCDIMDHHFVPNLMLSMELLNQMHKHTDVPFDYHIMAFHPELIIEKLNVREGDIISIHVESTEHVQMVLNKIHAMGAKAAVAINPGTPLSVLEELLPDLDMILLMTVNPGFAGQKIVPQSFDKIRRLRRMLDENGYENLPIQVDGNCSFENVPKMYAAGAEIFVVGTSSVFQKGHTIQERTQTLLKTIE